MAQLYVPPVPPPGRDLGNYWSSVFAKMMNQWFGVHKFDKAPSPVVLLPDGKRVILTDVLVLERHGQNYYCEVKHKDPTPRGQFGLERYRLDSLITLQDWVKARVAYVIHDYSFQPNCDRQGRRDNKDNRIGHWLCADIGELAHTVAGSSYTSSLINSQMQDHVMCCYWDRNIWVPLVEFFGLNGT